MFWIIQQNCFGEEETNRFNKAVEECGHTLITFNCENLSEEGTKEFVEKVCCLTDGRAAPAILRSSINFQKWIADESNWDTSGYPYEPFYYCDWSQLKCSHYYPRFEPNLLNEDYFLLPFSSVHWLQHYIAKAFGERFFVKPDSGSKPFPASVISQRHFEADYDNLRKQVSEWNLYDLCLLSSAKQVGKEFRFVIVEGKVVAGSQYLPEQAAIAADSEAWKFASYVADSVYDSESEDSEFRKAYTLDVCDNSGYRVVEVNSFSCAGLYESDAASVVKAVSDLAMKEFNEIFED